MTALDTAAFVILWLWVAAMILTFLWAVREIWRRYLKPERVNNWLDGIDPRGDATEEADANYTGWKPRGGR